MSEFSDVECYRAYKRWCISLGIKPTNFITWSATTKKINPPMDATKYSTQKVSVLSNAK